MTQTFYKSALSALFIIPLFMMGIAASAATPSWNVEAVDEIAFNFGGTDYVHDVTLNQDDLGMLTGNGSHGAYTWVITSGSVDGDDIAFTANYTATPDAVTPQTVMLVEGTIADNGMATGTWSDNYAGGVRTGTWASVDGVATELGALHAADFGVVDYNTGMGILKGYTSGFTLTDATFENIQSMTVKLYSGATLLQTNTATAQVGADITGDAISSPFDVSGSFNYVTDGYWVNVRESEYGQSVPATRVVATVTLENGQVLTVENNLLVGDPTTIYPDVVVPPEGTTPTSKNECKDGGWKSFTQPSFKNQGQCVSFVNHI